MKKILTRLYGGHRNQVFKTDGIVKIIWKDGFLRKEQIREGVLLENFVVGHTDIKARMLFDKSNPVQEEEGKMVTYFHFAPGEIRYPWSLSEIASAAKLLTRLHGYLKAQPREARPSLFTQLHLDFARGNILFSPGTSEAIGVIDFETTAKGPVEQELGRTLSFILVDSPLSLHPYPLALESRMDSFLTNYSLPYRKEGVEEWTLKYLDRDDYGSLNNVRDKALSFLSSSRASNVVSSDPPAGGESRGPAKR